MLAALGAAIAMSVVALVWSAGPADSAHGGGPVAERVNRYAGTVTEVGEPDAQGNIYSFGTDIPYLAINEIRSWRITFFSGELYAYVFQVRENTGGTILVTSLDGPLNGLAAGDMFLVEQVNVQRPTPQMRAGGP